jgi:hypothetical protein
MWFLLTSFLPTPTSVPSRRAIVAVPSARHDYLECLFRELEDASFLPKKIEEILEASRSCPDSALISLLVVVPVV